MLVENSDVTEGVTVTGAIGTLLMRANLADRLPSSTLKRSIFGKTL